MVFGNVYSFPLIHELGMGEVVLLLFTPYFIMKARKTLTLSKGISGFVLYMVYGLLITLIMSANFQVGAGSIFIRLARDFFYYFIVLFLGTKFFDKEQFFKWLIRFCVLLSVFVVIQSVIYLGTGYFIPGFPMNAQLNDGGYIGSELYSKYLSYARIAGYLRPNGFLCEPSHCAQCFFVALIVLLFGTSHQDRRIMLIAGLISIGSIATMSTSAIVYVLAAWILWLIKEGKHNAIRVIAIVLVAIIVIVFAYNHGNLSNMISVTNRLTNIFSGNTVTASSELRVQKGLTVFLTFPLLYKIVGIGFGTYMSAFQSGFFVSNTAMIESEYMNSFSYILVSSGIIGSVIMVTTLFVLFRRSSILGKMMIIALVIMSLGSSIYSSPICVWLLLVIINAGQERNSNI